MVMATNTDAVPRSGWAITISTGRAISPRARTKPGKGRSSPRSLATKAASTRMSVTLASSDGWSWNGPITNQARMPLRDSGQDGDREQQDRRGAEEEQRPVAQAPVVDHGGQRHDHQRAAHEEALALDVVVGVEPAQPAGRAGGRVDGGQADGAQPGHREHDRSSRAGATRRRCAAESDSAGAGARTTIRCHHQSTGPLASLMAMQRRVGHRRRSASAWSRSCPAVRTGRRAPSALRSPSAENMHLTMGAAAHAPKPASSTTAATTHCAVPGPTVGAVAGEERVVLAALLGRVLRRAGLPGDGQGVVVVALEGAAGGAERPAARDHAGEPAVHRLPPVGVDGHLRLDLGRELLDPVEQVRVDPTAVAGIEVGRARRHHAEGHHRPHPVAAVGEGGVGVGQLQRRGAQEALADGEQHVVAHEVAPALVGADHRRVPLGEALLELGVGHGPRDLYPAGRCRCPPRSRTAGRRSGASGSGPAAAPRRCGSSRCPRTR